jgi:CRP-like cAMP-binding protein
LPSAIGDIRLEKSYAERIFAGQGWLSRCPADFRAEVIRCGQLRSFQAGESLYNAGDAAAGLFGLVEGRLLVRVPPADTIVTTEQPGYWIGTATAFRRAPRWVTTSAAVRSHVLHLPQAQFEEMIRNPDHCRLFAIELAESLGHAVTVASNLTQPDSEVRVAQRLLTFMGLYGESRERALAVSQSDLATMCGLSRQTLGKVLKGMIDRGIIRIAYRRIEVRDAAALTALATEDDRIWR